MKTKNYATYDSVRATHEFFCGVYGAVRGVFRISVNSATLASE